MGDTATGPPLPPRAARDAGRGRFPRVGLAILLAVVVALAGGLVAVHLFAPASNGGRGHAALQVVAAENFWGSLVSQLGGEKVQVLSVVSDPNADPHEYESNTSDALAVANAQLVVENGAGYDDWCSQLVSADGAAGQVVVNVASILGMPVGSNPHFWYGQGYVQSVVAHLYAALVQIDPSDVSYFGAQYATLNASLAPIWTQEAYIDDHWGVGQPNVSARAQVASTESIFQYMANSTGLDLVSPYAFMAAVADGNDPPVQSVATFESQLESGNVSVLVYNEQTVTPLTQQMKSIAASHNVSVIGVTETIQPPNESFEFWMAAELADLDNALNQAVLGH